MSEAFFTGSLVAARKLFFNQLNALGCDYLATTSAPPILKFEIHVPVLDSLPELDEFCQDRTEWKLRPYEITHSITLPAIQMQTSGSHHRPALDPSDDGYGAR